MCLPRLTDDEDGYRQQLLADCRDLVQLLFRWRLVTPALMTTMKNTWETFVDAPFPQLPRCVGFCMQARTWKCRRLLHVGLCTHA